MSRTKRFAHSLISGYVLLAVNIVFTLVQGRMLLHYITTDNEVGLWAVAIQAAGYFLLLDLGMSGSMGRILVDYKDDTTSNAYGSIIKTGLAVLAMQGVLIAFGGAILSQWLPELMNLTKPDVTGSGQRVPVTMQQADLFRSLVAWQCVLIGVSFAGRMFGFILETHQRYDVTNYANVAGFAVNLLTLWGCFEHHLGLYSLLWSGVASTLCVNAWCILAVFRLKLLPAKECWGRVSWERFQEIFAFATDVFFIAVGNMLITASQIVVVGWTLGAGAAGVWTFTTKTFAMAHQLISRIYNYSTAALAEMLVRGEQDRLRARFRDLVILSAAVGGWVTMSVALCNESFLKIWTAKRMAWEVENDLLMALWILTFIITRCLVGLVYVRKELRGLKIIYVGEGLVFVGLAALLGYWLGFPGIILSGIVSNLLFSGLYGIRRTAEILCLSPRVILRDWMWRPLRFLLVMLVIAVGLRYATQALPAIWQLSINVSGTFLLGGFSLWKLGLPEQLKQEFSGALNKLRKRFQRAA